MKKQIQAQIETHCMDTLNKENIQDENIGYKSIGYDYI